MLGRQLNGWWEDSPGLIKSEEEVECKRERAFCNTIAILSIQYTVNMTIFLIVVGLFLVAVVGLMAWQIWLLNRRQTQQALQAESNLEGMVQKAFGMSANKIAEQGKAILAGERETIKVDLANKHQMMEKLVTQIQQELKTRQDEVRTLDRDRLKQFAELNTALTDHRKLTDELRVSTQQLASVLSNNQMRGEWGERIIEDLLTSNGLVEGVHYLRQHFLHGSTTLKPDITLLLPDKRVVPVDAKFPYQEIQKMVLTDNKATKAAHLKQFESDIRIKISKVALYIDPGLETLDYAIMFVPNEMIFSFINQKMPQVIDEALRKRVMIVSPFTFLIVARTVMESYRNFMMGDKLKEVVKYVDEFAKEWGMFKDEFSKFGRSIDTLKIGYDKITATRTRQLDRKLERIDSYRSGNLLPSKKVSVELTEVEDETT